MFEITTTSTGCRFVPSVVVESEKSQQFLAGSDHKMWLCFQANHKAGLINWLDLAWLDFPGWLALIIRTDS